MERLKHLNLYIHYLCIAIFFLFLDTNIAYASLVSGQVSFKEINTNQGLPNNTVNCMAQDTRGFVWMGTTNGLCRYDGLTFNTYRHQREDENSLADNNIHKLLVVHHGMYMSTDKGVDFYSFDDGIFHHCKEGCRRNMNRINSFVSFRGKVFATEENGYCYCLENTRLCRIKLPVLIFALTATEHGLFGVGMHGVYLLSGDGKRIIAQCKAETDGCYNTNAYYSKRTKVAYVGNGLGHPGLAFRITGSQIVAEADHVPANLTATVDYAGGIAFASDGGGVTLCNGATDNQLSFYNGILKSNAIYSLLADRIGNLWIGSYRAGANVYTGNVCPVNCMNSENHLLPFDLVTAVTSQGSKVFIGMDGGGMSVYDKVTGSQKTFTTANSQLPGNNIVSITSDRQKVWMAIFNKGLVSYDIATARFKSYTLPPSKQKGDLIWTICDDGAGNIWIGGREVYVFNKKTERFITLSQFSGQKCASLMCRGNYIWMGNFWGAFKINRTTHRVVAHYSKESKVCALPDNYVKYIYVDSRNHVWISFSYEQLCCLDEEKHTLSTFGAKDGLTDITVTSILEADKDFMVFTTVNGLFFYYPSTHNFIRVDQDFKVASTYNYNAACFDGTRVYLGSMEGLLSFHAKNIHLRQLYKEVSFIELDLTGGRTINLSGNDPRPLTLTHDENFFTIHFTVPEYSVPRSVRFAYYMKGLDDDWREMTNSREAEYTNVPPGSYVFMVRCTDVNGKWTKISMLHITVTPPWYATWWAKLLWFVLLVSVGFAVLRFYLRAIAIKHQAELTEVAKESQQKLVDAKMNFYTSITHELRTPVFLIGAQLEELLDEHKSVISVPSSYLHVMYRNAMKLNRLVSRVIDFRKMDQGKLKLTIQCKDVVEFCHTLIEDYIELCSQKNITFDFVAPDHPVMLDFDSEKLEMIISNLVSNAYKYTNEKGNVSLSIDDREDRVVFSVKDNGIGIEEKVKDTIFESFFRSEGGQKQSRGDGIGLSFVKDLLDMHGGTIRVESEVNKGSNFIFDIPKKRGDEAQESIVMPFEELESESVDDKEKKRNVSGELNVINPAATHSILVIDDERETVNLLERNLVKDFKIYKAYNGEEGLQVARETLPDLIICDMMMPKMDGLEFLKQLKNDKKLQHIKIIIFTAKTSEDAMMTAFDHGADAYLTKPISLKLLRTRVDRMIAESENATITSNFSKEKKSYNKEEQIFLLRCREIIDDQIQNPDFNIDFLADKLAMSHSALYKKIKIMTGMSLIEFINDYKIYKAVLLFKQGTTSIETVCEQCGFNDVKNFRNLFKRKMNMTPKQYVQSL